MSHNTGRCVIEIGGADQQHSTFDPLSGNGLNERIVHVRLDQFGQGRVVSQRRAFEQINQPVSAVVMNAEAALRLLLAQPTDTEAVRRLLACIVKDGMRTGDIVHRTCALIKESAAAEGNAWRSTL